ncbi:efflux RND transporter permease subunit [Halopseudomonas pachastrellae]|uniref:efflux RND transporter permease subunit n=1 Tax=Halopseudomonas pachastrellae TaxID=254161 RepID=UPI003D7DDB67
MFQAITRHGILVTVALLILCVLGTMAALRIPVQMIPDLETRTITVETEWPGATPQDIEKEILVEQEEFLRNLPNLERISSVAGTGWAEIELDFPFGVDLNETLIRVNNALTQVSGYPENVDQPSVNATSFSANAFMHMAISPLDGNPRNLDMDMLRDYIEDNVRPRLSAVNGVAQVDVRGGAARQVQVRLYPERLALHGLTPARVRDALRARNRDISGGEIDSGKRRFLLRTVGRFESLDEVRQLVVDRRGDSLIRLQDLADVTLDHARIGQRAYVNGAPVISLAVRRESGSNVIAIKDAMLAEMELLNQELLNPQGMQIKLNSDDVVYVRDSVFNVWKNLILGALLASLIMYLFLRSWRVTLIGVLGIPVCTIAAFLGLMLTGRTINVISLAGVAFAIGMTLDNSIVVLESIELERRRGMDRLRAAVAGVSKVWPAILASTLTTVMVFLPVMFIQEEAGQLYSDIAIAITSAILVSMLVAITAVPAACARLRGGELEQASGNGRLAGRCADMVGWLLATARRRLLCALAVVGGSLFIVLTLTPPAEYLPEGEEAKTFAMMNAPPGYNLASMQKIADQVQAHFLPYTETQADAYQDGDSPVPAISMLMMNVSTEGLWTVVVPRDPADIDALMAALVEHYRSYPGMRAFATRGSIISSNDGGTRSINLDISGPDLATLYDVARLAYDRAGEIFEDPSIQSAPSSLSLAQPLLQVYPDWERAAELGLDADSIGFSVAALTDGSYVGEYFQDDDKVDIYFYNAMAMQPDLQTLRGLTLYTPSGQVLPLSSLARIEEEVDTSMVRRVDGRRTLTLNIIPPRSVPLEAGVEQVRTELVEYLRAQGQVPLGVNLSISGAADQLDATRDSLSSNYLAALLIVFLLLVAIFRHWGYPLLIMISIPLGMAGGLAGLALLNLAGGVFAALGMGGFSQPLDMITMLGFLILMGTVVNNPILIVDRSIDNLDHQGMTPIEAVREAVEARLRPIAISTLTTLCGIAPLVFLPGAGTELYRGVGVIVMAGILGATLVTLTLLPVMLYTVLSWRAKRQPEGAAS